MLINAHTQNAFIQRVYREHSVPMMELFTLFYSNPVKANIERVSSILYH